MLFKTFVKSRTNLHSVLSREEDNYTIRGEMLKGLRMGVAWYAPPGDFLLGSSKMGNYCFCIGYYWWCSGIKLNVARSIRGQDRTRLESSVLFLLGGRAVVRPSDQRCDQRSDRRSSRRSAASRSSISTAQSVFWHTFVLFNL
jgi:hypothetical protein